MSKVNKIVHKKRNMCIPVNILAFEAGMPKETWKYFAIKVTNPVEILCSITITILINSHVLLLNISRTLFGKAEE